MERVVLNYPRVREGLKILIFGIPKMRFIDFEKKGRIWLISFDPKIALTSFCKLIIHAILNLGFSQDWYVFLIIVLELIPCC